jgi:hypothetical protein
VGGGRRRRLLLKDGAHDRKDASRRHALEPLSGALTMGDGNRRRVSTFRASRPQLAKDCIAQTHNRHRLGLDENVARFLRHALDRSIVQRGRDQEVFLALEAGDLGFVNGGLTLVELWIGQCVKVTSATRR